jgi:cytochrome oxidase assembly protein ShyY1
VGRYRFLSRPKWVLFSAVMLGLVVLMVNLALWQLRRLHERRTMNAEIVAAMHDVPADATAPGPIRQWRTLTATGTYDESEQVLIRNRSYQGQPGFHVVTPLKLASGRALLVNRGWVPLAEDGSTPSPPAPPSGQVVVTGRARESQRRGAFFSPRDPSDGTLRQLYRVDVPRIAQQTPYPLIADYIELLTTTPAATSRQPVLIPAPELDDGPHLSYAGQWMFFSGCVVAGWILVVRRTVKQQAKKAALAASNPTEATADVTG